MKKQLLAVVAITAVICASTVSGCSAKKKDSVDQNGKCVFPVSSYDETLAVAMGDVMPFYDDGVMNIYHLQDDKDGIYYHPISRLTTVDYVNYTDEGIALNYEKTPNSVDAALGTGSFIKDKDGNYHCFYTGHNDNRQEEDVGLKFNEVIRHAKSTDGQKTWSKVEDFKLYGYENDFRDPYVYYDADENLYRMLVTTRDYGCGVIKSYSSASLDAGSGLDGWKDDGVFFKNDAGDYNMECPSYIEYNGFYYLAYSEQGDNRVTHYRYRTEKNGEWKKFSRDSIDSSGFYAGRLEKAGEDLYAFAWCAKLSGGSTGGFDWGGNLVVHKIKQMPDGELCAVMVPTVKDAFGTEVQYKKANGEKIEDFSFGGEKFQSHCAEKLAKNITRISFGLNFGGTDGDCGITFGLDGKYDNRLGQGLIAFDSKNKSLTCYNSVSSVLRYGSPLASVAFEYEQDRDYSVEMIIEGEILTVYLDETVCLTARIANIGKKHFAFYSNGADVQMKGITFYE